MMKHYFQTFVLGFALILSGLVATPGFAQDEDRKVYQGNEQSTTFGSEGIDPFNVIHQMQLGNGVSSDEFQQQSNQSLDNATEAYRQQLKLLWSQPQADETEQSAAEIDPENVVDFQEFTSEGAE